MLNSIKYYKNDRDISKLHIYINIYIYMELK